MNDDIRSSFQAVLEGEIKIMSSLDALTMKFERIQNQLARIEQRMAKIEQRTADTMIIGNNALNETEEIRSELNSVSDKIDTVGASVDNIKIYRNVSNFEV